jgi:two-component system OmpR family response regulator
LPTLAPARILLVDDDPNLREVARYALEQAGFAVEQAANGRDALAAAERRAPDLIVLDVRMPELDGLEVCRALRKTSSVPIVFLSSADEEIDRVLGLELGGDDYLGKPFSPRELVARVKAVLRRREPAPGEAAPAKILRRGRLSLDGDRFEASWDGRAVILTVTEFNLLAALLRAPGKVFTRDELIARAYDGNVVSERTIDSHLRRVRQKFAALGAEVIETVHGVGYRLSA